MHGESTIQVVGALTLALYHMVVVIVVSKLVISALQTALQNKKGNEDSEWKFAKTALIMSYFNNHDTLPSPFNLIPSPKIFRKRNTSQPSEVRSS